MLFTDGHLQSFEWMMQERPRDYSNSAADNTKYIIRCSECAIPPHERDCKVNGCKVIDNNEKGWRSRPGARRTAL